MADLGYLKVPDFGLTPYPDKAMVDGVKSFQKDHGLKVDGVMKKDGPTINRLNRTLTTERFQRNAAANDGGAGNPSRDRKPVQVAAGPLTPLLPFIAPAARGLSAALSAHNAATAAQKLLDRQNKRAKARPTPKAAHGSAANDPYARSEIPDPPRQTPGLTPPNQEKLSKGGKKDSSYADLTFSLKSPSRVLKKFLAP